MGPRAGGGQYDTRGTGTVPPNTVGSYCCRDCVSVVSCASTSYTGLPVPPPPPPPPPPPIRSRPSRPVKPIDVVVILIDPRIRECSEIITKVCFFLFFFPQLMKRESTFRSRKKDTESSPSVTPTHHTNILSYFASSAVAGRIVCVTTYAKDI